MRTSLRLALVLLVAVGSCTFDPEKLSTPGIRLTDGGIDSASDEQPGSYDSVGGRGDSPMLKPDTSVVTPDGQGPRETNGQESAGIVMDVGSDKASPTLDLPSSSDTQQALPDVPMFAEVGPADVPRRDAVVGDVPDDTSWVDGSSPTPDAAGKLGVGLACTQASQCERGFCVDGVCCETACTSMCTTCNLMGNAGYCSPVPAGVDPKDSCTQDSASTCGRDGTCDGSGGCRPWPSGTECASASCTAGTATIARTCDGAGTCRVASSKACAPYACKGTACTTQCSGNSDCDAGSPMSVASYCSGGTCLRRQYSGSCTSAIQCAAGNYCNLGLQTCAGAVCACPASCPYSCISNDGYTCTCQS
jgi:hypothetical protein